MTQAQFIHDGAAIDYLPAANVSEGEVVVLSELIGVAKKDIAANAFGALAVSGVFDFAKESGAGVTFSTGDKAYWDEVNHVAVPNDGAGANKYLGKVVAEAANSDDYARIRLGQCR